MTPLEIARSVILRELFVECANAGYGRMELHPDGSYEFEAYPGCYDAAADYIESIMNRKFT